MGTLAELTQHVTAISLQQWCNSNRSALVWNEWPRVKHSPTLSKTDCSQFEASHLMFFLELGHVHTDETLQSHNRLTLPSHTTVRTVCVSVCIFCVALSWLYSYHGNRHKLNSLSFLHGWRRPTKLNVLYVFYICEKTCFPPFDWNICVCVSTTSYITYLFNVLVHVASHLFGQLCLSCDTTETELRCNLIIQ